MPLNEDGVATDMSAADDAISFNVKPDCAVGHATTSMLTDCGLRVTTLCQEPQDEVASDETRYSTCQQRPRLRARWAHASNRASSDGSQKNGMVT